MEPILQPNENRYVLFPIKYPHLWELYKKQQACLWTAEELQFNKDHDDWAKLSENEQTFIKNILAFFAGSDGIVFENLDMRFLREVQIPELTAIYSLQCYIEHVHSETYSLLIDTYVKDDAEKTRLFNAILTIPCVGLKAKWAIKWINSEESSFAERLVAFAAVEAIFFSGSFCAFYWLKQRKIMPGLTFSNELIARDEGMHVETAVAVYNMLVAPLSQDRIYTIIGEAIDIETEFMTESIPCAMIGMNATLMKEYIRYVADRLIMSLGYSALYGANNPFEFMEMISLQGKTNFFEKRVSDYSLAQISSNLHKKGPPAAFNLSDDF